MSVSLTPDDFAYVGSTLYRWLGSFWTRLYEDKALLQGVQQGRSLRAAQTYLTLLESLSLRDHNGVPVFHRERWYPLVIRRSAKGTGGAVALRFGDGASFGEDGVVFGGCYTGTLFTSYPVENVAGIATCIVDNIVEPSTVWLPGQDFVYRDGTIILRDRDDPFLTTQHKFAVSEGDEDAEVVLWACDTMHDKDMVFRGLGYALGLHTESSEFCKRVLTAYWDILNVGATSALFRSLLAAVYGIPCCIEATETVEVTRADGLVVTDKHVYATDPAYACLRLGQTIHRGDSMDSRLRVYTFPFTDTHAQEYAHGIGLRESISTLQLPTHMLPEGMTNTVTLRWTEEVVTENGTDANGNWKIRFRVSTDADDDDRFWEAFWERCEDENTAGLDCFTGYISDIVTADDEVGTISPLRWYLEQVAGPGTILVWVKPTRSGRFSELVRAALPSTTRLVIVEAMDPVADTKSLTATGADSVVAAVGLPMATDTAGSMQDQIVATRWVEGRDNE